MARSVLFHVPGHEPRQTEGPGDLGLILEPQFHWAPGVEGWKDHADEPRHGCRRGHRRKNRRRSGGAAMSKINQIEGKAVPIEGNDIDTDRIIPARYLKEITFTNMGQYPF